MTRTADDGGGESARYDSIGRGYAEIRRADPRLAAQIRRALGDARTVVNVGAGAGSYEPEDCEVVAVEPSAVMIAQRPHGSAPAVEAAAESLPFEDGSFDAAMSILSVHHWSDLGAGLAELARVARRRVVITTFDPAVARTMWVVRDYLPEAPYDRPFEEILELFPSAHVEPMLVPRDCTDRMFATLWARPEEYLDQRVREAASVWHVVPAEASERALRNLRADLESGDWDRRYGYLRALNELDVGLRLIRVELGSPIG